MRGIEFVCGLDQLQGQFVHGGLQWNECLQQRGGQRCFQESNHL